MQIEKPPFPYEAYQAELCLILGCSHADVKPRRKRKERTGQPYYRLQCVHCGAAMSGQLTDAYVQAFEATGQAVYDWDEGHYQQYLQARAHYGAPIKKRLSAERHRIWWEQYAEYRQTPAWRAIRKRVFKRDGYRCQVCHSRPAEQAHHLSYERIGHELDSDLISVCAECHTGLHADQGTNGILH